LGPPEREPGAAEGSPKKVSAEDGCDGTTGAEDRAGKDIARIMDTVINAGERN
jgi:hypothetical protein